MVEARPWLEVVTLAYFPDPAHYFASLRHRPGAILLDSGRPHASGGRFDILSSDPLYTLALYDGDDLGEPTIHCVPPLDGLSTEPFAAQRDLLEHCIARRLPRLSDALVERHQELPFLGGLMGQWSYTLANAHRRGNTPRTDRHDARRGPRLPRLQLGVYDWALIQDHATEHTYLVASAERRDAILAWLESPGAQASASEDFSLTAPFHPDMNRAAYGERFRRVLDYLHAGDCYQINLAQRFTATYRGDLWQAYRRLRAATPTPYAGYFCNADHGILSLSPERFVRVTDGQVETCPIKGTRPRGRDATEDRCLADELETSAKDRAENVMIVDLLRNDLGQVCRPGSVHVPKLCGLETYANVHHLVSVVQGELARGVDALDLLAAAFPGGSITGAPKMRAMQIIDELEPTARSLYCGSLGYMDRRGRLDTSIAIRTLVADGKQLHIWGGGGLVADSDEQVEYAETLAKIAHLMQALGGSHQ